MVTQLEGLGGKSVGFRFLGEISKEDYDNTILPALKSKTDTFSTINLMMVIETELSNFTAAAWLQDAIMGLKNMLKMHRVAIVSDSMLVKTVTPMADKIIPGEYKVFKLKDQVEATNWVTSDEELK